ncbi:hypothetical protein [Stappia sp. ES.058]|uniref:hypothetical protein n=1 Tax=Stappia sp. ES.058 TaxID=1881061 RepID=UPI00087CE66A|nr:hypothetical protein [Stappia sp. ES.058]SDU14844.1 hypothetical protein SAMN05428979_1926 [Stappia sp. ES.058]
MQISMTDGPWLPDTGSRRRLARYDERKDASSAPRVNIPDAAPSSAVIPDLIRDPIVSESDGEGAPAFAAGAGTAAADTGANGPRLGGRGDA